MYEVPRKRLRNRIKGIPPKEGTPSKKTKLTPADEKALCNYIDRLDRINLAVRPSYIKEAADLLLQSKVDQDELDSDEELPHVGVNWASRFIKRHQYSKVRQKKMDSSRKDNEDVEKVRPPCHVIRIQFH